MNIGLLGFGVVGGGVWELADMDGHGPEHLPKTLREKAKAKAKSRSSRQPRQ